jgi:hypothetical protein
VDQAVAGGGAGTENSIRMWANWELIVAVKHFRQKQL